MFIPWSCMVLAWSGDLFLLPIDVVLAGAVVTYAMDMTGRCSADTLGCDNWAPGVAASQSSNLSLLESSI